MRSRRAHRRSTKTNTLKRVRVRIKVHHRHHRRYAGVRGGRPSTAVKRAAKPATTKPSRTGRKHPHKGWHGHRKRRASSALTKRTVHRRKGYHVHRKKGYHLTHPRRRGYHIPRRKGLKHPHKGSHAPRHRRKGLHHPHKGSHKPRHFYGRKKKQAPPPAPAISPASYLSMF